MIALLGVIGLSAPSLSEIAALGVGAGRNHPSLGLSSVVAGEQPILRAATQERSMLQASYARRYSDRFQPHKCIRVPGDQQCQRQSFPTANRWRIARAMPDRLELPLTAVPLGIALAPRSVS